MNSKKIKTLETEELKNTMGGVVAGPNGEGCTERGIKFPKIPNIDFPNFLKGTL